MLNVIKEMFQALQLLLHEWERFTNESTEELLTYVDLMKQLNSRIVAPWQS